MLKECFIRKNEPSESRIYLYKAVVLSITAINNYRVASKSNVDNYSSKLKATQSPLQISLNVFEMFYAQKTPSLANIGHQFSPEHNTEYMALI